MVNADVVEGEAYKGWVFINWLYPGKNKVRAVKDVLAIEKRIVQEGMKGWFAESAKSHTMMHTILQKMGAVPYGHDDNGFHFMKEVR